MYDYGKIDLKNFDEKVGNNDLLLKPIRCPDCGKKEFPEHLSIYADNQLINRLQLGSRELPVVGGDVPYGVTLTPEEQVEMERGMMKVNPLFEEEKEQFWDNYCTFALENWKLLTNELTIPEFQVGYKKMGFSYLPSQTNVITWRKDANKRLKADKDKKKFWMAANKYLVDEFIWDGNVPSWPIQKWVKQFGRNRISYITLHLPLPEELERYRSEKLSLIIRKKSGDTNILFQRIGHLGQELDRQRRRSEELSRLVMLLRQERAGIENKLSDAYEEIRKLQTEKTIIYRDPDDIRKIRAFKGLISELRAEVSRLEELIPEPEHEEVVYDEPEEPAITEEPEDVFPGVLEGKTIAMFGKKFDNLDDVPCEVVWHDGHKADQELESLAIEADVYVVLTRLISHEAMWRLKELAIDYNKIIIYSRETNFEKIIAKIARLYNQ